MSPPKRVLHIVGVMNRAGAETFLMNLYRQLDLRNWQFDFVRFGTGLGDFDEEIAKMGGKTIDIGGRNLVTRSLSLFKFLRSSDYRIVHAHTGFSSSWFLAAARLAGVRARFLHSHSARLKPDRWMGPYRFLSRWIGSWAQTVRLSCGELATRELHRRAANVITFPNCIQLDDFRTDPVARNRIRAEFGVRDDQLLVIHIARLEAVKNHELTLALAERFLQEETIKLVTVGTGAREAWLLQEISRRGLKDRMIHAGLRHDIPAVMAAADLAILPSHYEGFPVVAVEAQAAGLYSIFPGSIDPAVDTGLGLVRFIDNLDVSAWGDAILTVSRERRDPEAGHARLAALNFDSSTATRRYQALLESAYEL